MYAPSDNHNVTEAVILVIHVTDSGNLDPRDY